MEVVFIKLAKNVCDTWKKILTNIPNIQKAFRNQWGNYFVINQSIESHSKDKT